MRRDWRGWVALLLCLLVIELGVYWAFRTWPREPDPIVPSRLTVWPDQRVVDDGEVEWHVPIEYDGQAAVARFSVKEDALLFYAVLAGKMTGGGR